MNDFYAIKEKVTAIYKEYESYFQVAFKFLVAFFVFGFVNSKLGYYEVLSNFGIQVVLSLISAIIPSSVFVLLVAIVTLLHLYKLSLVMMILAFVVFVVFYFIYLKFAPRHGVLMMVIPVLMPLNLHFIVPLIAGLFFTPFTIIPVASSFILVKIVECIVEAAPMVDSGKLDVVAIVEAYQYVIDHVLENKEMLLYGIVFAMMILLTYVISRFSFDYVWYVAIGVGAVAGIVGLLIGAGMIGADISAVGTIFGGIISGLFVALIQFLHCTVDYSRKEFVQFEDDDYYYYVKALPKVASIQPQIKTNRQERHNGKDFKESLKQMFSKTDDDVLDEDFDDMPEEPKTHNKAAGRSKLGVSKVLPKERKNSREASVKETSEKEKKERVEALDLKDQASVKNPEIIIPELKIPSRDAQSSKTFSSKNVNVKPSGIKNETSNYDFDFDDDGYDDSMEDYGSDDSDFGKF